jgi:hypothetical protein
VTGLGASGADVSPTPLTARGTEGSNPSPSSGESANPRSHSRTSAPGLCFLTFDPGMAQSKLVDEPPDGSEWLHEIKFDGYRLHARLDREAFRLVTRAGLGLAIRLVMVSAIVGSRSHHRCGSDWVGLPAHFLGCLASRAGVGYRPPAAQATGVAVKTARARHKYFERECETNGGECTSLMPMLAFALKGGVKPPMASPAELAAAIRRPTTWPRMRAGRTRGQRSGFPSFALGCDSHLMVPLSVLDLSPITERSDAGQALRNSLDLARHVEALGYRRFWMAEHHNLPGIASAATAVALAHVAAGTNTIRIGAGGIMLPNHAPLLIAEQFGTLAALHPGRVELGLGRAPGSDQITARAVRRALLGSVDSFPQEVVELMGYFEPAEPGQAVQAVPGAGLKVPDEKGPPLVAGADELKEHAGFGLVFGDVGEII